MISTAYLWHNYGKSVIGSRADIEKVPIDRLAAFYSKYYQPDNAVLVIAGQFDQSKALAVGGETCGAIPRPTRKLDETYTVEPVQDGERYVELRRVGTNQAIIDRLARAGAVASGFRRARSAGRHHGGRRPRRHTGRLYKALIDNKKALSVNMEYNELHDPGFVMSRGYAEQRSVDRRCEEDDPRHGRRSGDRTAHEGRSGARERPESSRAWKAR